MAARGAGAAARPNAAHRGAPARNGCLPKPGVIWLDSCPQYTETRWATTNPAEIRRHASELAALAPDVILAHGTSTVIPLLQAARSVPIVFAVVADPVGAGIVQSLARPGGNATGFMNFDFSMGAKWLELLKEIAPEVTRVAVLRDAANPTGIAAFSVIQAIAPLLRVEVVRGPRPHVSANT